MSKRKLYLTLNYTWVQPKKIKKYANGKPKRKNGADKTKQLAHKIHNKKHGVVNNINDFLLGGYKESIFQNDCIIKEKNKNLYSKIDNIQCIILNIAGISLFCGTFFLIFT